MSNEAQLLIAMANGYPEFKYFYEQMAKAVNLDDIHFDDQQVKRALQLLKTKPELNEDIQRWSGELGAVEKFGSQPSLLAIVAVLFLLQTEFHISYKPSDIFAVSIDYEFQVEIIQPVIDFLQQYGKKVGGKEESR